MDKVTDHLYIPKFIHDLQAKQKSQTTQPPVSTKSAQPIVKNIQMSMKPGSLALKAGQATSFKGSDNRLEITVPADAVTAADLASAGGSLSLKITQIAPASGSNAGGSGRVSLGRYLVQVVDSKGVLASQGLRKPATLKVHFGARDSALDLAHAYAIFNPSLPEGVTLASVPGMPSGEQAAIHGTVTPVAGTWANSQFGGYGKQRLTLDPANHILSVPLTLSAPSSSMSFDTDSAVAGFGTPDPFNADLNAAAITGSYPIDIPPGPGGLTPPVSLAYNSDAVNSQHNLQAAASWVGEGFSLGLGSISWSEHNVNANCPSGQSGCTGALWEDNWYLNDSFGTSAELMPPDINVGTYYEDGANAITPSPVTWHTTPETRAKVISFTAPFDLPYISGTHARPPCFRVFLANGIMEEFGCTLNSIGYYPQGSGTNAGQYYLTNWYPDLITDRNGNQVHLIYTADTQTGAGGLTYPRDIELSRIEYDSPTCHDAQAMCTGSAWTPLVQVNFLSAHTPTRLSNTPSGCNTGANLRCDDPQDLTSSGGLAAPIVQSTFALNDIQVQVRSGGAAPWNTLRDYQLTYDVSGPDQLQDPVTGLQRSTAGHYLLTQWKQVGTDGSTALPAQTFTYQLIPPLYIDSTFHPTPADYCTADYPFLFWGITGYFNTGHGSGCFLWDTGGDNNSAYLSTVDNGLGMQTFYGVGWLRNNTHGVPVGQDAADPNNACYEISYPPVGAPCDVSSDQNWSRIGLISRTSNVVRPSSAGNVTVSSTWNYEYKLSSPLVAQECGDCVSGMYWGNQNDGDFLDYYNGKFMGFAQAKVTNPDGSVDVHKYYATMGYGVYDLGQVTVCSSNLPPIGPCHNAPWWDIRNAGHGHEIEVDHYDTDGTTLLSKATNQYQAVCPASGVSGTPAYPGTWGNWDGNLVSQLDRNNPVASCDIQQTQSDSYTYDGAGSGPQSTTTYIYDTLGRPTDVTHASNDGGATGSPTTVATHTDYIWNDAITATSTGATGTYVLSSPAFVYTRDSGNTTHYSCNQMSYDGAAYATGQQATLTQGRLTANDVYTGCGTSANSFALSGKLRTTTQYNTSGQAIGTKDADANAGVAGHTGCTVSGTAYTACTSYDTVFTTLPVSMGNALNQTITTGYTSTAAGGYGFWPTSTTDANGQISAVAYDVLGRQTSTTLPGEGTGLTTSAKTYTVWCASTGAQTPCIEVDDTQRLNSSTTVTQRSFYDGMGRLVETRTPAPSGQDVIVYTFYDAMGRPVFVSNGYFVAAYTGGPGASAFATPDASQVGTTTSYTSQRSATTTDALSHALTLTRAVACNVVTGDATCYEQSIQIDALNHKSVESTDSWGRLTYSQSYTGNTTATYAVYGTTKSKYNANGNVVKITHPDGATTTTFTYNAVGRKTGMTDADRASETYTYDQNGNLTKTVDARGAAGTIFAAYDGLNRLKWRNTTNSATGAYVTRTYDSITGGNKGIGRLTSETFSGGSDSGSYSFTYDARGQVTNTTLNVNGTNYPTGVAYNDAGQTLTVTYPTGETVSTSYSAQAWFAGLTRTQGTTTTLVSGVGFTGVGGAGGMMTGATLGGGAYTFSAAYDNLRRPTQFRLTKTSNGSVLFEQDPTYDAVSEVTGTTTVLTAGNDVQKFCYDDLDRLTWAGSVGTSPCGAFTPGSLTSAQYTQTFAYDKLNRLTSGPLGAYTYGASTHKHAATAIGTTWSAAYDTAGNMSCRAPTSAGGASCAGGTNTNAQQLTYDNEGRLTAWQDLPSSPTSTAQYLYDGSGTRVLQRTSSGGTTTTTVYVGQIEAVATTGATTTTTTYYYAGSQRVALAVNGTITYLAADALGSSTVALDGAGNATASQLYAPYGTTRYTTGAMPTDYGFTGQRKDSVSGLNYYGARYYDSVAGQFTSADLVQDGLNRYGYVHGNPTSATDPTGQFASCIGLITNHSTGPDAVTGGATCVIDAVIGAADTGVGAALSSRTIAKLLTSYKTSYNLPYLSDDGAVAFDNLVGKQAHLDLVAENAKSLVKPWNILPGWAKTSPEMVADAADQVLHTPGLVRGTGVGGGHFGARDLRPALNAVDEAGSTIRWLGTASKIAGVVGTALTVGLSGYDDYQKHQDVGRAAVVGLIHGAATLIGGYVGGAAGTAVGGLFGPGAVVMSPVLGFVGAGLGAAGADWLAGWAIDRVDSGDAANAWNGATSAASDVWSGASHLFGF